MACDITPVAKPRKRETTVNKYTQVALLFLLLGFASAAEDYYKVLGVERNASQREIQKAFHRQSLKYHPDKNPSKSAKTKFTKLSQAYDTLSDETKRRQYDLFGEEGAQAAEGGGGGFSGEAGWPGSGGGGGGGGGFGFGPGGGG
eukprot:jgi/Mesen1/9521/ME000637S08963